MSGKRNLEFSRSHVPEFHGSITSSGSEPFIARVHSYSGELPRTVPFRLFLSQRQKHFLYVGLTLAPIRMVQTLEMSTSLYVRYIEDGDSSVLISAPSSSSASIRVR
ncbi:hypothetical protein KCU61_g607, partial [Aureobasidium melanogenum]